MTGPPRPVSDTDPARTPAPDREPANTIALSDLAMAAFCPRKLYYARETDRTPPKEHDAAVAVSGAYREILNGADPAGVAALASSSGDGATDPLHVSPERLLENLERQCDRLEDWESLVSPGEWNMFLRGKDVHGTVTKVLHDPPAPSIVSPGEPPPEGVWQPQSVRAVGAAKALSWELERPVERAYVEYPLHGTIRRVDLTTRRTAVYRRTRRSVEAMDGPPPRLGTDSKCQSCRFAAKCGVKTRSLRSLL